MFLIYTLISVYWCIGASIHQAFWFTGILSLYPPTLILFYDQGFPVLLLFLLYSSINLRGSNLPLFAHTSFLVYVWISHSIFRVHCLRKWICTLGCLLTQKEFERHFNQFSLWISSFKCKILVPKKVAWLFWATLEKHGFEFNLRMKWEI